MAGLNDRIEATEGPSGLVDVAKLKPEQRAALEADSGYQPATGNLKVSANNLRTLRKKLFDSNSDWIAGKNELLDAKRRSTEDKRQASLVGAESRRDKQLLNQAQQLAWEARRVIAEGEVRLRQLGAKPLGSKSPYGNPKQTKQNSTQKTIVGRYSQADFRPFVPWIAKIIHNQLVFTVMLMICGCKSCR